MAFLLATATGEDKDNPPLLLPTAHLSVRLKQTKFVQPNLAVAEAHIHLSTTDNKQQFGFVHGEPCSVFVRTPSDVSRLQSYIKDQRQETPLVSSHNNASAKTLSTGRWLKVDQDGTTVLRFQTVLTKAFERNRRGIKLVECQEILAIEQGEQLDHAQPDVTTSVAGPSIEPIFRIHDKSKRHTLFAEWLIEKFGKEFLSTGSGVLDVAGGKGELSLALSARTVPSVLLDPEPRIDMEHATTIPVIALALEGDGTSLLEVGGKLSTVHDRHLLQTCSIIVGMHPDQATEPIVLLAQHLGVPFALLPCCVMPSLFLNRVHQGQPVRSYRVFCLYLQALQEDIREDYLSFMGRNMILYRIPRVK